MRLLPLLLPLIGSLAFAAKHRTPPPPDQPDIVKGCLVVSDIHSHKFGWTSSAGVSAVATNNCDSAVEVFIRAAYFNADGYQFKDDIASETIAAHAKWLVFIGPKGSGNPDTRTLKRAEITSVEGYTK